MMIEARAHVADRCANPPCGLEIIPGQKVMFDDVRPVVYCEKCGKGLRFHRKRAVQREESPPITHADAERRFEER